jgi:hypothetical protein
LRRRYNFAITDSVLTRANRILLLCVQFQTKLDGKSQQTQELNNYVQNLKRGFQSREVSLKQKLEEHKTGLVRLSGSSVALKTTIR